jgi:hypothetical protein
VWAVCRKIKDQQLENLLPDFDFERVIGGRLRKVQPGKSRPVVVIVVDAADFDGSFPRRAAEVLLQVEADQPAAAPRLVLVLNKVPHHLPPWGRQATAELAGRVALLSHCAGRRPDLENSHLYFASVRLCTPHFLVLSNRSIV